LGKILILSKIVIIAILKFTLQYYLNWFSQVLAIINAEEDVLDDKGVIEALKEAKADVFETLNDLTAEKKLMIQMEKKVPSFKQVKIYIYPYFNYPLAKQLMCL